MYKAFDHFGLGGSRDWSTEFLTLYKGLNDQQEKEVARLEGMRVPNTTPSLPLSAYAGKYTDPLFGTVEVTPERHKPEGQRQQYGISYSGSLELRHFLRPMGKSLVR